MIGIGTGAIALGAGAGNWAARDPVARNAHLYFSPATGHYAKNGAPVGFSQMGTFEAAGTRFEEQASGLLVPRGVDVPRLADYSKGARRWLMESGTTPLTKASVFSGIGATISEEESDSTFASPNPLFEDSTAVEVRASAGAGRHVVRLNTNFTAPAAMVDVATEVIVQKGTATHAIVYVEGGGPGYLGAYSINLDDGSVTEVIAASGGVSVSRIQGGVWSVKIVDEVNGTGGNPAVRVGPHDGSATVDWTANGTETIKLLHNQTEIGDRVGSAVRAYGSPVTRAPEFFTSDLSGLDLSGGGWVLCDFFVPSAALGGHVFQLGPSSNRIRIYYSAAAEAFRAQQDFDGSTLADVTLTALPGERARVAMRFGPDAFYIAENGSFLAEDADCDYAAPDVMYLNSDQSMMNMHPQVYFAENVLLPPGGISEADAIAWSAIP